MKGVINRMSKTQVKFLSGFEENLPELIVNGQLYFVVSKDGTGKILFDRDNKRYVMTERRNSGAIQLTKQFYQIGQDDIYESDLVALDKDGLIVPAASASFLVNSPLFISASDHSAKEIGDEVGFYNQHHNILIKNKGVEINGIPYKPFYLKGKIFDGLFKPSSDPYTFSLPKKEDGYCYIYIGEINAYRSMAGNNSFMNFSTNHPIYQFKGDEIQLYAPDSHVSIADKLSHTLTIGEYKFDGSEDVEVPVYYGETL